MTGTAGSARAVRYEVWGLTGIPEVRPGQSVAELIIQATHDGSETLADGDVVVVTSKIVSKAEGRVRPGTDREAAIDAEAVRTVSEWTTPRGRTRVVETRHGFVMAAAGVDASNVANGTVVLLPEDPDASARRIRDELRARLGVRIGVIVTDTAGRVWRNGVVDMAIGAAGVVAVDDLRGKTDPYGNDLGVTVVAVADELAAATELVRTKLSGVPVAVVRGLAHLVLSDDEPDRGAAVLIRPASEDRFQMGTPEAMRAAVFHRRARTTFSVEPVDPDIVRRAVAAALTAPFPAPPDAGGVPPIRFVVAETAAARTAVAATLEPIDGSREPAETLATAPFVLVPCVIAGDIPAAGPRVSELLAVGAAVENLLIVLAADGLGAAWLFPRPAADREPMTALELPGGWTPMGAVIVGRPDEPEGPHEGRAAPDRRDVGEFMVIC